MRKTLSAVSLVVALACHSVTAPLLPGDDPSPIVGSYGIATVNGKTAPATLDSSSSLVVQLGDATLWLYADGTYLATQYVYEISPTLTRGIPSETKGHFAKHGATVAFDALSGVAPENATIVGTSLRVVVSLRSGRAADTLTFTRRQVGAAER